MNTMILTKGNRFRNGAVGRMMSGAIVAVLVLLSTGCGMFRGQTASQPVPLSVRISGGADLNGGGNAAFVQVYQLSDNAGLRNALPESFWQSPEQLLGESLLSMSQIQLFPGADEALTLELHPAARYVGIAANLRAPDRDRWRSVVPVADVDGRSINVTVDANSLSAELQ